MSELVTAVVCGSFDPATDAALLAVRAQIRSGRPRHRPHFSFAAARVTRDELPRVVDVAAAIAAQHEPVSVVLDEVGRFRHAGVVWLGPQEHAMLSLLQHAVDAALRATWQPAFVERDWVAHCTLARLRQAELHEVWGRVRSSYRPITATVDALAVILVGGTGDVAHLPLGRGQPHA